jgi:superfamily II DNA or RNA helicase
MHQIDIKKYYDTYLKTIFKMKVKCIGRVNRNNEDVFNLEVEGNNNYFANNILVSNCHKVLSKNKVNKVINTIPAVYKYGMTGTLPDNKTDRWNIIGHFGSVIINKTSKELRDEGYISDVVIAIIKLVYSNLPRFKKPSASEPTAAYEEELQFLQTNKFRNETICKLVNKMDKNVLIMVDRLAHGEHLLEILKKNTDKQIHWICGEVEIDARENVRKIMEEDNNVVCIAISKIFSTGINIKNLHYIIFASIGKARIKLIQTIGRSLRVHASKERAVIIDLADNLRYGRVHVEQRIEIYKRESINYTIKEITEPLNT